MNLAWRIEFTNRARKQLDKIARHDASKIIEQLELTAKSKKPRAVGKALKGKKFENLWRYRVGDYRILCQIEDGQLLILIVEVGHRRQIYR